MKEMEIMKQLKHRHLIQLIGVCSREIPYYLLTEFMTEGCLLDFIRKSDPAHIDHIQQLQFALQVCLFIIIFFNIWNILELSKTSQNFYVVSLIFLSFPDK